MIGRPQEIGRSVQEVCHFIESSFVKERTGVKSMEKGLVHIYCGDGKGKTSAAIGLAVRAAGNGMKVLFTRFLKTEDSGELKILDQISGIEVIHLKKSFGFFIKLFLNRKKKNVRDVFSPLERNFG